MCAKRMQKTLQEWSDVLAKDDEYWDQNAFNELLKRGYQTYNGHTDNREDRLFRQDFRWLLPALLNIVLFFCQNWTLLDAYTAHLYC